ncbi:exonuclease domain-containing protein [Lusitaniella coriacea LEGE 07157]|uniref:Exonuclease domain-containing protein n=1 Tax=Lusitaniella coriacea LEGE 07157 TaxID=945747 RepID=A0A8J7E2X7_9CYAN|nr:3'-5' exonuclease [Lusitaniella coriacea]MBE9118811.1 exonuclease domain-containing protein [Lusitaniella coriacea LEGE 07157]
MELNTYDYFMVLDLEATCCDRKTIRRNEMEIIEIGAVMVEAKNLTAKSEFQTFVKPIRYPILTEFCKQLTSITQEQVDRAPLYPEAVELFQKWMFQYSNFIFGSWGDYDRKQIEQDSRLYNIPYPIACPHINLKQLFTTNQKLSRRYGMAQALELAEIELEGTHHRGIDDARNITQLLPYILGREILNSESK